MKDITITGGVTDTYTHSNGKSCASAVIDFSNINSANHMSKLIGKGVNYTCCTCTKTYSIKLVDGNASTSGLTSTNPIMEVDISSITTGSQLVDKIMVTAYGQTNPGVHDPSNTLGNVTNTFQMLQPLLNIIQN